jgi:hypothetical protein
VEERIYRRERERERCVICLEEQQRQSIGGGLGSFGTEINTTYKVSLSMCTVQGK